MNELQITRVTGAGKGHPLTLRTSPVSLGTASGCDLKFDPTWDRTVSSRHAFIEWNGSQWMIQDAGSREGTLVNGRRIHEPVPVGPGAELELGSGGPRVKVSVRAPETETETETVTAPAPTPPAEPTPSAAPAPVSGRSSPVLTPVFFRSLGLLVLAAILGLAAWKFFAGDSDTQLASVARQHENCVGLVVVSGMGEDGQPTSVPMATAWAVGENVFATNSHVTGPVADFLEQGQAAFVIINKNPELKFRVTQAVVHPKYATNMLSLEGKEPAVPAYDVGLLYVEGKLPNQFRIAPEPELTKLDSGYRVAYLGFPMEGLAGGGVDYHSPVATMQSGIITANTDYWLAKAPFGERLLVAHNLGTTGGSSGSPVFNQKGEVVAILSAANIIGQVQIVNGRLSPSRAPSGVLINYAQRIDALKVIYPEYGK